MKRKATRTLLRAPRESERVTKTEIDVAKCM